MIHRKSPKAVAINSAIIQRLESRTLFSSNLMPTALEVYAVELINRARADPSAEVTRLASNSSWAGTPDLNEGLPPGTISTAAKQPLAISTILTFTAHSHSQWEITNNQFSHNENNVTPFTRMTNAGYAWHTAGENIATESTTGTLNPMTATSDEQNNLFIDAGIAGRGHRTNMLNANYNEVGSGIATGVQGSFNVLNLTQDFGNTNNGSFLTGITYKDTSGDNFFQPGEEDGGVTITATRASDNAVFTTTSWPSGGYSMPLAAGTYRVVASGGNIGAPVAQTVTLSGNVEADFQQTASPAPVILTGLNEYLKLDADGTTLDVYASTSATGTPTKYPLGLASSLSVIPTTAGAGVITVDYSAGNFMPSNAMSVNGSAAGVNLSLKIYGPSGGDSVSVNATTVLVDFYGSITYTGLTNITDDGAVGLNRLTQDTQPGGATTLTFANTTNIDLLSVKAGTFTFPQSTSGVAVINLQKLDVEIGATLTLPGPATHATRTLLQLALMPNQSANIDLGGNDLDITSVDSQTLASVTTMIQAGFSGGTWAGNGIHSSAAAGNLKHLTGLGVIQNNQSGTPLFTASNPFDGITPGAADILVKATYYGDTNLDGKVDGSDYSKIDGGFTNHARGWSNGDFNYDNVINGSDYTLIDNAFNAQGATITAMIQTPITKANDHIQAAPVFLSNTAPVDLVDWLSGKSKKPKHLFVVVAATQGGMRMKGT